MRRPSVSTLLYWPMAFPLSLVMSGGLSQAAPHKGTKWRLLRQLPRGRTRYNGRAHPRMSLIKLSSVGLKSLAALVAVMALPSLYSQSALAADTKRPVARAVAKPAVPTGAELVGKLLAEQNGPSDPDVPLPQRGLSRVQEPTSIPLSGPQMFGRQEEGGGVFGLKIPIPATRSTF